MKKGKFKGAPFRKLLKLISTLKKVSVEGKMTYKLAFFSIEEGEKVKNNKMSQVGLFQRSKPSAEVKFTTPWKKSYYIQERIILFFLFPSF